MHTTNSVARRKRHRKVLKMTKGYRWGRKNVLKLAKNAIMKAGSNAYAHRRTKKREYRQLWITRLSAAVREMGYSYSVFQHTLTKQMVLLNRKVLSNLAVEHPEVFRQIVEKVMKASSTD